MMTDECERILSRIEAKLRGDTPSPKKEKKESLKDFSVPVLRRAVKNELQKLNTKYW